jgi:propionyl-CoA carboxylase beta chain
VFYDSYNLRDKKVVGVFVRFRAPLQLVAVMGAKGASEIIFKKEISEANRS